MDKWPLLLSGVFNSLGGTMLVLVPPLPGEVAAMAATSATWGSIATGLRIHLAGEGILVLLMGALQFSALASGDARLKRTAARLVFAGDCALLLTIILARLFTGFVPHRVDALMYGPGLLWALIEAGLMGYLGWIRTWPTLKGL